MRIRTGRNIIIACAAALIFIGAAAGVREKASQCNKEGLEFLKEEKYEEAIESFTKALVYAPENRVVKENLAYAYNGLAAQLASLRDDAQLDRIIDLMKRAVELAPGAEAYGKRLSQALAAKERMEKAQGGEAVYGPAPVKLEEGRKVYEREEGFKTMTRGHFIIAYEATLGKSDIYKIESMLNDAYRVVGQDFDFFPEDRVEVVLYGEESFRAHQSMPEWATGLYDGKMRLPLALPPATGRAYDEYKGLLYHEYTHALLNALVHRKIPVWLEEGLARYEENRFCKRPVDALKGAVKKGGLIPIGRLDKAFYDYEDVESVNLAYEESLYIVLYILDRYDWAHIRDMLKYFTEGGDAESVAQKVFGISFEEFEGNWKRYLDDKLAG